MSGYERENRNVVKVLSEDREWRRSCDVSQQVVPYCDAGSCECATANCRSTNNRYVRSMWLKTQNSKILLPTEFDISPDSLW